MTTKELIRLVENERGSAFQNCNDCEYRTHNGEMIEKLNRLVELEDKIRILEVQLDLERTRTLEEWLTIKEKETAEKFAKRLKEKLEENVPFVGYDLEDCEFDGETIQECINEILKEITKGRDEFYSRDN